MSYLSPLRLHFFGSFVAAPSTVNNDPAHFDNATFKPEYQLPGPGTTNGWWNPSGDANWRLLGCTITGAYRTDGTVAAATDPVLTCLVADSDRRAAAKLADLDSQQQMVSEIWGLEVRIATATGDTLMRGRYQVAPFMEIWTRWPELATQSDIPAGAMYQSVLTGLEWGDVSHSPMLSDLRAAAETGLLSIKFNVDKYNMNPQSPRFTQGRIAGTVGPASADEPCHWVLGRQLMARDTPGNQGFFVPVGGINSCVAVVDEPRGKILLDLGNALPSAGDGTIANLGTLSLACQVAGKNGSAGTTLPLGDVDYLRAGWYESTAGVVELPPDRTLTAAELATIAENPLLLAGTSGTPPVAVSEPPSGLFARADGFVFRLDAGGNAVARVYATRFGKPLPKAVVQAGFDNSQLQGGEYPPGTPRKALKFPASVKTDARGVAELPLQAKNPGNPRKYIDGQLYGVRPLLKAVAKDPAYPVNAAHFISVLVWDAFDAGHPPTWYGGLQPVFQQFANLYPIMARFLDLADYASVCANRNLLLLAFGLDPEDPNYMPATRELSMTKRAVILRWLNEVGADGKPLLGTPKKKQKKIAAPPAAVPAGEGIPASSAVERREDVPPGELVGGKAAASARRLEFAP